MYSVYARSGDGERMFEKAAGAADRDIEPEDTGNDLDSGRKNKREASTGKDFAQGNAFSFHS